MDDDAIFSHSVSEGHFMLIANSYETRMITRDLKLKIKPKTAINYVLLCTSFCQLKSNSTFLNLGDLHTNKLLSTSEF